MKSLLTGLFIVLSLPAFSQIGTGEYSPTKSIITCRDTESGYSYRFQYAGNWLEFKSSSAKTYTTCATYRTIPAKDENAIVTSKSDYGLVTLDNWDYSSSGRTRATDNFFSFQCRNPEGGKFGAGMMEGVHLEMIKKDSIANATTLTIWLPFSSAKIASTSFELGTHMSKDKLPANLECTNLDAPRFSPKIPKDSYWEDLLDQ